MKYNTISDAQTVAGGSVAGAMLAGRYRIVRQLGQGGMGSVWLAEDTQLDNMPFAVKMLPSILVSNKRAYRQLKDEALVAMRLVHPNIVQIRAFEENNGNPFLVMDYIDGETLDDYLAEQGGSNLTQSRGEAESQSGGKEGFGYGLPEEEVVRILRPIAAALDYAHGEGVVHRDVKPANVMIRKDGHPFILDFGIAREIQETLTRVTGKLSSGTLLYMSPEQLNGERPKPAQDVYSFAAMAYECLKGEPPFVRGAIEDQIKNKVPEPLLGHVVPNAPQSIVASVMAGLAKKPEDRPKNCAAVLEYEDQQGCSARIATPPSGHEKIVQQEHHNPVDFREAIPEEDRRYLPPDMRMSLEKDTPTGSVNDGGASRNGVSGSKIFAQDKPVKTNDLGTWIWIGAGFALLLVSFGVAYQYRIRERNSLNSSIYHGHQRMREGTAEDSAKRIRSEAELAMSRARQYNAESVCPNEWADARAAWLIASAEFGRHEYDKAKDSFAKSSSLFWKCVNKARAASEKAGMQRRVSDRKVEEIPSRTKEERRMVAEKPRIYLTATLNGVQKNALITEGLQENNKYRTPLDVNVTMSSGSKGKFAVVYFENGVKYVGTREYTVKSGRQNIEISLVKEPEKRFPRPATMNFCRHCRYSLENFATIGLRCPVCGKNLWGN